MTSPGSNSGGGLDALLWLAALLACGAPVLMAYNPPPSASLLKQAVAVAVWGGWLIAVRPLWQRQAIAPLWPLLCALGCLFMAASASTSLGSLPASLAWSAMGLVAGAALMAMTGAGASAQPTRAVAVAAAFFGGLVAAGVLSATVSVLQVFIPPAADTFWLAASSLPGRAVGNLRQPNHLCSLLLWAMVAAVALHELRWFGARWLWAALACLVLAVELSASRTGALGLAVLLAWGLIDRRLSRPARLALVCAPLLYLLAYAAMASYASMGYPALGAGARWSSDGLSEGGSRNVRPNIWRNAWALVQAQPLLGTGFGEFNLAWTLTPFDGRPTAFFDHAHNLPLQLAVELGLPLAALVLGLLAWALWQGLQRAGQATGPAGTIGRAAMVLVLVIGVHSLVEYPLWYAYFLLPTAFAWGLALGLPGVRTLAIPRACPDASAPAAPPMPLPAAPPEPPAAVPAPRLPMLAGALMVAGGALAVQDYLRVSAIYQPAQPGARLADRIAAGQASLFFAHHADFAAATNPSTARARELAFARAPHALLDARMMVAWAHHLHGQGRVDEARWLAARLREFDNPGAAAFFAPCQDPASPAFQCQAPRQRHPWRSFMLAPGRQVQPPAALSLP